jgi:hypothetical protein
MLLSDCRVFYLVKIFFVAGYLNIYFGKLMSIQPNYNKVSLQAYFPCQIQSDNFLRNLLETYLLFGDFVGKNAVINLLSFRYFSLN